MPDPTVPLGQIKSRFAQDFKQRVISIKSKPSGSVESPMHIPSHLKSYSPQNLHSSPIKEGPLGEEASTIIKQKSEAALARE